MEASKVDMFIMANAKNFESYQLSQIRDKLTAADESKSPMVQMVQLKDPSTSLIISIFVGHFGIDRFIIGDVGIGVGKLLTCGGFGIWTIIDWFMIQGATREKNMEKMQQIL